MRAPSRLLRRTGALALVPLSLVTLAVGAPTAEAKPGGPSTGTGLVFRVNPVQSTGDQSLTDQKDSATAVPASAYARVPIRNLDGSGYLRGRWVVVESSTGTPAYSTAGRYDYDRSQDQFEQVMGYFWVDRAQEYLQSLGFGSTLPGVVDEAFPLKINQYGGDNSYQTDKPYRVRLGKGGVDDAEDAEVVVHEYGHAVQADQVPGFGASLQAGSIGEAFGDYWAVTVGLDAAQQYGWPVRAPQTCVADWDSTSYTSTAPHCLRRLDTGLTTDDLIGEVHFDGQVWSQALWEIRQRYVALGLGSRRWDTTLVDSQFGYAPDTSFSAAAKQTWQTALARDGQQAAAEVKARFAARGITF